MKKRSSTTSAFFNIRVLFAFFLCLSGGLLGFAALGAPSDPASSVDQTQAAPTTDVPVTTSAKPQETRLVKTTRAFKGDLRNLPRVKPAERERPELEEPEPNPKMYVPPGGLKNTNQPAIPSVAPGISAPAPAPINVFEGLDRFNWGAGSPPDTNGDVGPTYYIQTVNTSIGIFRKSDGFQVAAFTFDTFMSQGHFGNLCDTNNFGDPVVLYDSFEDRWIITDFAFVLDASNNVVGPAFQCVAASQSGDPVMGGWNFYSTQMTDFLGDYPKLGIWPDGLYMSANMFSFGAGATFQKVRVFAFNKAQMYAGSPTVQIVSFDVGGGDFTILPSNARLQTGTPPAGRPNLFLSTQLFLNALTVYKFHVDWNSISLSTFTGPDTPVSTTSWPTFAAAVPQPGTSQTLDSLSNRAMVQNQYTNFSGTESLWVSHTVRRQNTSGFAAPRWYQVNVTGGTVAGSIPQAATWDPDGANVIHRWMPSLALDRGGNMAMGYSTSNSTTEFPSIKYAGRLAADPANTFSLTEQTFFTGTASQLSSTRWGDYSAMTLDPDGCTFWYTTEYATGLDTPPVPPATVSPGFNQRWKTKFGSFVYSQCTPVGSGGTVTGTVTNSATTGPLAGVTVALGARTTTTDGSGNYSFTSIPAGTYPIITASFPGYNSASATSIAVTDGGTTTQNFALTTAPANACPTDTTQADFLTGEPTNVDLNTSPGNATLSIGVNQQNTAGTTTGTGFGTPSWTGQTFVPSVTGQLLKADVQLFCSGCTGTTPNLTLSVRNTSAGLPTGADLATATIPGSAFASGGTVLYTASFGAPATLASGTQYVLVLRPVAAPSAGGYFWIRSSPSTYANGSRVLSADSGATWSADSTRDYNFKVYINYTASGTLASSPKDANPAAGRTPIWSTFSWTATEPANSSVKFQLAGSNSVNGPFNFVGPDGTAATSFTNGAQLSPQFYNLRFLKYKALFATTDSTVTPTLSDTTLCFNDVDCSTTVATITPSPAAVCPNSVGNTASGPAGMTSYAWSIANGTITSATNTQSVTYTAGASGTVTLSLTVTGPNGCIVSNSVPVTINPTPPTPTVTPGGPTTFCAGGSVLLSSSSATGNQWFLNGNPIGGATNQDYSATASGSYTVTTTASGCSSAASAATVVTVNPLPATPTITPGGPTTFCAGGSVGLTSSSGSGNQWFLNGNPIGGATNQLYTATASGNYTVAVTDGNGCTSAPSAATVVTVNPNPNAAITAAAQACASSTGNAASVANAGGGATYNWSITNGTITGGTGTPNITYTAGATGTLSLNVTVTTSSGCSDSQSANVSVISTATPTISPSGTNTFCSSLDLTSSSATGNQWYLNGNPIGGATAQTYNATAAGSYTVVVTTSGCASAPSAATTLTANTPPVLTYQTQATAFNGSITINPATGPSDNVSVSSIAVQSQGTYTGTISVNNTTGVVSISNAAPIGTHTIVIRATDNCGTPTDASFTLTVNKAAQAITVGTHAPASAAYNSQFTVAATADSSLAVSYSSAGACTNTGATYTMTSGIGTCTVKYDQAGDTNYNAAPQVTESVTASKAATGTGVVSDNNPSQTGQQVTFTATVSSGAGTPTGVVTFKDGASSIGTGNLGGSGQASLQTSSLSAGNHTITAEYGADSNFAGSVSGPITQAVATPTPTATPTATATATATVAPSATATPTATPTASPARALNISTRAQVDPGNNVMIGGFIITGNAAKPVVVRGLGPSLSAFGVQNVLADPLLELRGANGSLIMKNDNWKDDQRSQIEGTAFQPSDDRESVIVASLPPASYTAILMGKNQTSGVGIVEVYDTDNSVDSQLANISTRAFVRTGDNVMIGGFTLGANANSTRVAIRGLGPSLTSFGLANLLADPMLEVHNASGTIMVSNDDWQSDPATAAQLTANGLALQDAHESGIFMSLPAGPFTAILSGKNGGIGIGVIEVYNLK